MPYHKISYMGSQILPYLILPNAKQAIEAYQEVFDLKIINHMPFSSEMGGMPDDFDFDNSTMHSLVHIDEAQFYMADDVRDIVGRTGPVTMMLEPASLEQMKKIANKAKTKGWKVLQEFHKSYWDDYFAMFEDEFGVIWQMNKAAEE